MNPSWHVFLGILFSIFLFFMFPEIGLINLSLVFLSSILIDVDHYIFYIYHNKDFNLRKAYNHFIQHKIKWKEMIKTSNYKSLPSFFIFHGLEVLLLLFVLSIFFRPAYFVFVGFSFHLFLDLTEQAIYSGETKKFSLANDYLNYKN